jgi:hypothetical protein
VTKDWARPVVAFGIEAKDPECMRTFYSELFSWDIGDGPIMSFPAGLGAKCAAPERRSLRRTADPRRTRQLTAESATDL